MAIPSPFRRPALLRISDKARWPNTMAATKSNGIKNNSPQIRLTMAFPLVSALPSGAGALIGGAAAEPAEATRPQARQNLSSAVMLFPQPAQNDAMQPPGARNVATASH